MHFFIHKPLLVLGYIIVCLLTPFPNFVNSTKDITAKHNASAIDEASGISRSRIN